MDQLEQLAVQLRSHGWEVTRPPFDDPYEIMYRRMMQAGSNDPDPHPDDDYMSSTYQWGEWDTAALAFLKEHFVLKTEVERLSPPVSPDGHRTAVAG